MSGAKDRCGPTSNCLNRTLQVECPKVSQKWGNESVKEIKIFQNASRNFLID